MNQPRSKVSLCRPLSTAADEESKDLADESNTLEEPGQSIAIGVLGLVSRLLPFLLSFSTRDVCMRTPLSARSRFGIPCC